MRVNEEMLAAMYDGLCTVYVREEAHNAAGWIDGGEAKILYENLPCHLAQDKSEAVEAGVLGEVRQGGTLFLGASRDIPAGSEVEISQNGRTVKLALSGAARKYALHQEIRVKALAEYA